MRKPIRLQRAGARTARDDVWDAVRRFGTAAGFSCVEVAWLSDQRTDTTLTYLRSWCAGGFVKEELAPTPAARPIDGPRQELQRFRLVRDVGVDAPRLDKSGKPIAQGRGREEMWNTARKAKGAFDWRDMIQRTAHPIAASEAQGYLNFLARAGYLRRVTFSAGGRGKPPSTFEFIRTRDTGPRPPVLDAGMVRDGNTGEVMLEGAPRGR